MLIERYNGKKIANYMHMLLEEDNDKYSELNKKIDSIQSNLTEKHLRVFRRLAFHNSGLNIVYYPMEKDSNMYLDMNSGNVIFNNSLLEETYYLANKENSNRYHI